MIVGCGNSRFPEELYESGYQHVTCIDFSYSAIQLNQEEYKDKYNQMTFTQMDVRNLQFKDSTFDVVLDKACLDAVICGDGKQNVDNMLSEIHRVL